jgi:aromatic-L-amino-acid decarboxylase
MSVTMGLIGAVQRCVQDRAAGYKPFCVLATVGTVNTGAYDDLHALADLCEDERLWLHVDGAFGAIAQLSPKYALLQLVKVS